MAAKNIDELAESFDLFDNWEDRYAYLIDLGGQLEPMEDSYKTADNLVKGCTSQVWLVSEIKEDEKGVPLFYFTADSDARIVKGLIYILVLAYQSLPVEKIADIDIQGAFERLGLSGHLSPGRRNGFFSMVDYIKNKAS